MDFKPNEFFIGLVEFITVLLPGAVLALIVLLVEANHHAQGNDAFYQYAFLEDTRIIFWVVFVFSSFGLGYFLSSIASGFDPIYDTIRKQYYPHTEDLNQRLNYDWLTENQKKEYLVIYEQSVLPKKKKESAFEEITSDKEKVFEGYRIKYSNNYLRKLLSIIFNLDLNIKIDRSYEEARKILNTQPESVRNATNTYKWAGTILEAHYPAISEQATRIMSASKFFRSIVLVSFIFLFLQLSHQISFAFWEINCLILVLSFREYIVQRQKSVQKTYQSIVTLTYYNKKTGENNQSKI